MNRTTPCLLAAALAAAAGCQNPNNNIGTGPIHDDRGAYNRWSIETVNDGAVRNAIVAQHTLYPYHFIEGSSDLNDLGKRDVAVLAAHHRRYPGQINLRKGNEEGTLYQARVKSIVDGLVAGGVAQGTVKIGDGMPGGDGISADRVVVIMEADTERLRSGGSGSGSGATTSGGASNNTSNSSSPSQRSSPSSGSTPGGGSYN